MLYNPMSQKACIFWTLQKIWRKTWYCSNNEAHNQAGKMSKHQIKTLENTLESFVTVFSNRQKESYTATNWTTLLKNAWKCLLRSDSFGRYCDYLLQTTTDCSLVLHWHRLTVFTQYLLNAQSLMYIIVALSLCLAWNA